MFVLTVDQVASRTHADAVTSGIRTVLAVLEDAPLPAERTAGDEFQALTPSAEHALTAALALARTGGWSIGIGVGSVSRPLPSSVREATGAAFVGARAAVERAKRAPTRVAVDAPDAPASAARIDAFLGVLLALRARRTAEGWELHDLLAAGLTQSAAAARLKISAQAASQRARAADLRVDAAATVALTSLLDELNTTTGGD